MTAGTTGGSSEAYAMADWNYDDFGESPDGGSVSQAVNWVGAAMSLVLIAGLATWGWQLLVRDVTGVPVVRALDGPMRIAPTDPGGDAAEYQGLAVNRIAAEEIGVDQVDEVRLAPPPVDLAADDMPMGDMITALETETTGEPLPEDVVEVLPAPVFGEDTTAILPAAIAAEDVPSATDLAVAAALAGIDDIALVPASLSLETFPGNGPKNAPRPLVRPASVELVSLATPAVTTDAPAGISGQTAPVVQPEIVIASGTRLVQLGAYGSEEIARREWASTMARFGDYMVGKTRVIQTAETGGQSFYRLRALGFEDLDDARQFCSVLVAEGANCIPVVQQ